MTESVVYKDLGNGTVLCNVCSMTVKTKVWTAHVSGRKHRESVVRLKKAFRQQGQEKHVNLVDSTFPDKASSKRKLVENTEINVTAKRLSDVGSASDSAPALHLQSSSFNTETPWQTAQRAASVVAEAKPVIFSKVEGVPVGFFDTDRVQNSKKTIIDKNMRQGDKKFVSASRELPLIDMENITEENENDEGEKTTFLQNDIESIDEQIEAWKRVNKLEKLKEEVFARLMEKKHLKANPPSENDIAVDAYEDFISGEFGGEGSDESEGTKSSDQDFYWRIKNFM